MSETMDLHHSIDAKHAQNIGEQSVSDRIQAVIEIVKNSYDADALNCTVKFFARSGGSGTLVHIDRIVISDDGIGMTFDDIKNKWMRLATASKIKDNKSPKFARTVSGQKGMGHFATQKLGSKIVLISNPELYKGRKSSDDYDKTFVLSTDWDMYTPGKSFDEIPNRLVIEPRNDELNLKLHAYKHGLTIEITNLKEDWTQNDVEKVQRHLGALQIPKFLRSTEKNAFNAEVKTDGFNIEDSQEKDISDYAPWTIKAHLRGDKINYEILELNYKTLEKSTAREISGGIKPRGIADAGRKIGNVCGDADFYVYWYPGKGFEYKGERELLSGKGGWIPKKIVKEREYLLALQRSNAGIKIFHDNIRIRPYGDPMDPKQMTSTAPHAVSDWLGLQSRGRTRMGDWVQHHAAIGYVLLTRKKNPDIQETTTRQAIVENNAFQSLREDFALESLKILEQYIKERKADVKLALAKASPAVKAMSETRQLEEYLDDLDLTDEQREGYQTRLAEIAKQTQAAEQELKDQEEELYSTVEMYRNLSSLGISALSFHHELMQPLARIGERQEMLLAKWDKWDDDKKKDYIEKTLQDVETIIDLNGYIKQFASLFSGAKGARRKRVETNPREAIESLQIGFEKLLLKYNIDFSIAQAGYSLGDLWLHISSFQSIMLNLIGNSINALQSVSRKEKWIKVEIEKKFGHLEIRVSDNGYGILEDSWNRIFDHHWTTKKLGTGMGLTIVREIVEQDYGGTIKVEKSVSEEDGPGAGETTFLISIPLSNLEKGAE
jgi:hypothetical protein